MSGLGEVRAASLKSVMDHQLFAHYCHQLPSGLHSQHAQ
jgi:hypothetical protein